MISKTYRVFHKPTGLYFCKSRQVKLKFLNAKGKPDYVYVKSNLSRKGRIYAGRPSPKWFCGRIYNHVKFQQLLQDGSFNRNSLRLNATNDDAPLADWTIIEVISVDGVPQTGRILTSDRVASKSSMIAMIESAPASLFDWDFHRDLVALVQKRLREWESSPQYAMIKHAEEAERNRKNNLRRQTAADRAKLSVHYAKKHLIIGDLIKVSGTRDRHGIRLVVAKNDEQIICRKLKHHWKFDTSLPYVWIKIKGKYVSFDLEHEATTHGVDKLVQVFTFGSPPPGVIHPAKFYITGITTIAKHPFMPEVDKFYENAK